MNKILANIQGHDITLLPDGRIIYTAAAMIDGDGSGGNSYGDPDFQPQTSLRVNGKSLNAETERFIVVPPAIVQGVAPVVLGCQAEVSYNGKTVAAVVADEGPAHKLGEISIACAQALGIPHSPLTGGVSSGVGYVIHPGVPAVVDGKTYPLQAS